MSAAISNILDLNSDVTLKIFNHLPVSDIFRLFQICKQWRTLLQNPEKHFFWKNLIEREWKIVNLGLEDKDYYRVFRSLVPFLQKPILENTSLLSQNPQHSLLYQQYLYLSSSHQLIRYQIAEKKMELFSGNNPDRITCMCSHSSMIFTGGHQGNLTAYRLTTHQSFFWNSKIHSNEVIQLSIHQEILWSSSKDLSICQTALDTGDCLKCYRLSVEPNSFLVFETFLFYGSEKGTLIKLNFENLEELTLLSENFASITTLFTSDQKIWVGCSNGAIHIWNEEKSEKLVKSHTLEVTSFCEAEQWILSTSIDKTVGVINKVTKKFDLLPSTIKNSGRFFKCFFLPPVITFVSDELGNCYLAELSTLTVLKVWALEKFVLHYFLFENELLVCTAKSILTYKFKEEESKTLEKQET